MTYRRLFVPALLLVAGVVPVSCGGAASEEITAIPPGEPVRGESVFHRTCIKCHGSDLRGIEGSGPDLTASEFIRTQSDLTLVNLVRTGREMNHPLNTTGIAMPPYGANEVLTVQELADVVTFMRTRLQPDQDVENASNDVSGAADSGQNPPGAPPAQER